MVDIIILNPISSFKVDFDSTFFVSRPNFYLKIPLMIGQIDNSIQTCLKEHIVHTSHNCFTKSTLTKNYNNTKHLICCIQTKVLTLVPH